ncbi:DUF3160 domain-containing protein, partial [Candidatus Woesearchaeota archaeon]|nr:DUF3160 domain-containing protein [Candidatus Woesearchaeota archaeon]
CYCEDYSQYVPRGHYTSSEELQQYFKSMMWLGRITFKVHGEDWTKQAVLFTESVKAAEVLELWNKIYKVTGFFAGASDDLTFYEYDAAINEVFSTGFDDYAMLSQQISEQMQAELREQRGPKILGGFEFDFAGNLKDTTQGMRLMGQRYAVDSHVLSELVYNNVGVNPESEKYQEVLACNDEQPIPVLTKPKEFYEKCSNMNQNKVKYWNEICDLALRMHLFGECGGLTQDELYSVCRFMPTGLDVMSALGSRRADELLEEQKTPEFCDYPKKNSEMKQLVENYDQAKWTENLYNSWLWMIQPLLEEKAAGYPNWMNSELWKNKELVTALSSWAQLRHDTILYVKQSYTRATGLSGSTGGPISSRYYGYVEPNPELYARAKFLTEYLIIGLEEQDVITEDVKLSLEQSRDMMERLQLISQKELEGTPLTEEDYNYIESIDATFNKLIEELASALTIETNNKPVGPGVVTHTSLAGKEDSFKTTIVADVHTETNTKNVLEVGTGKIDWVVVAHASKDGRIGLAVGPMFSYYEFPWPMKDRLTDEKWRDEVIDQTERPDWIAEFIIE